MSEHVPGEASRTSRWLIAVILLTGVVACHAPVPAPAGPVITLGVPQLINQTPGVATDGRLVAVSWTAIGPELLADAYVSVSRDSGATFETPVRVNDVPGDVRASEQQAPRLAMAPGLLAVIWTSRRASETQIRLALSRDEGRTFAASQQISTPHVPGTRGWGSVLIDEQQRVHVLWLDTKLSAGSAPSAPAATSPMNHADHMHGGAMKAETRQDVYEAVAGIDGAVSERVVATGVCFCCKTALVRQGPVVFGAWRDVYPGSLRDISFARLDAGDIDRVRVSEDNWKIEGCPEDGPALATGDGRTDVVWPTLVDATSTTKGVFDASTTDARSFTPRFRLDSGRGSASHPAIAAGPAGRLAVWDVAESGVRRIEARQFRSGAWQPLEVLASGPEVASPAVSAHAGGFIVAWGRRVESGSTIEILRLPAR